MERELLEYWVSQLCEEYMLDPPEGFPEKMSDEDMERWIETWDEFDPYETMEDTEAEPGDSGCYTLSEYDTPVCNHVKCVGEGNKGYTAGIFIDGTPFEAELYEYYTDEGKYVEIGVMLPVMDHNIQTDNKIEDQKDNQKNDQITGFRFGVDVIENGVLYIGMVDDGYEEDMRIIDRYTDYLVHNDIIDFTSGLVNGSVRYLTDVRGTSLAYVSVGLTMRDEIYAHTNLRFRNFPIRKQKHKGFTVVK